MSPGKNGFDGITVLFRSRRTMRRELEHPLYRYCHPIMLFSVTALTILFSTHFLAVTRRPSPVLKKKNSDSAKHPTSVGLFASKIKKNKIKTSPTPTPRCRRPFGKHGFVFYRDHRGNMLVTKYQRIIIVTVGRTSVGTRSRGM